MKNLLLFVITFIIFLSILCCWYYIIQRNLDANFSLKNIQFGKNRPAMKRSIQSDVKTEEIRSGSKKKKKRDHFVQASQRKNK